MKIIIEEYSQPIYPVKVWVAITDDIAAVLEKFGTSVDREMYYEAITFFPSKEETGECGALIIFTAEQHVTIKNIAHESSHAAKMIFEHIGADCAPHEPFEYLVGYVAKCCEDAIKKHKMAVKKEKDKKRKNIKK